MNTIITYYLDLVGEHLTVSLSRVFLGATLFLLPFVACAIGLWVSESNLLIFTGPWASKFASAALLIYGFNISFGVFFSLGEGHSEYMTLGEGASRS
ncbi:MAG: hypothetical protein ING73_13020 [Rhodocyclaceae bacterium]|jgi:hypothetical protein|nr:hypothetical protein [Rhodocyclaceae bacterium]MCA3026151.1 hypothetical protein [Rhodocyclaceae bacterium]MCA3031566.1 hypothetical protein [Rhodocyclaceae bacterium]MCA3035983.1 hypothetical protein [Rhodocyclaceae bacterium]MCA3044398.1 hypothetical protein [Rhodocyclaceae bacterium]